MAVVMALQYCPCDNIPSGKIHVEHRVDLTCLNINLLSPSRNLHSSPATITSRQLYTVCHRYDIPHALIPYSTHRISHRNVNGYHTGGKKLALWWWEVTCFTVGKRFKGQPAAVVNHKALKLASEHVRAQRFKADYNT